MPEQQKPISTSISKSKAKEKESKLIEKIQKAKKDLSRLQDKRRSEIGKLACKYGLDIYDDRILDKSFFKLSEELANAN